MLNQGYLMVTMVTFNNKKDSPTWLSFKANIKDKMTGNGHFASKTTDYTEEEVISHLWVQLLIHINIYFYGVWLIVTVIFLNYEFATVSSIEKILSILSLVVAIPLEVVRLYLGHTGNLMSAIPSFAGFLILSLLIQLPLQIYLLLATHTLKHIIPTVVQSITIAILVLQIVVGIPAMRKLSAFRRKQFQAQRWQYVGKRMEAKQPKEAR